MQAIGRVLERAVRDVESDDSFECGLLHKRPHELSFAAAKIDHRLRARRFQGSHDRAQALLVESERSLKSFLFARVTLRGCVGVDFLVAEELPKRVVREAPTMLQVTLRDELARRVRREPTLAVTKELRDLVVADEVVLLVVEHRHEDVDVREKIAQLARGA